MVGETLGDNVVGIQEGSDVVGTALMELVGVIDGEYDGGAVVVNTLGVTLGVTLGATLGVILGVTLDATLGVILGVTLGAALGEVLTLGAALGVTLYDGYIIKNV